ncbi:hypothetical protein QP958_11165 [Corynebacterium marquesiae]|uniref:hypothetical protein n=1 Tax=Corynebacterium marquesiae TaxID=2913503 RepID=UPI00254C3636|nr:hypothetical protein [Corynebacterium marquesiae]MDK8455946.1 hypothetical protein [Corynebacterium marquesiae]MDK8726065.1 hypothetical protein [Corynebacterium marquesiae]MDK8771381.1 hypothetical protein [Corynebacterium marquesiae]
MKPSSLLPGLIAGIVLGLALWLGSGSLWLLLGGVVLGLMGASLLKLAADPSRSRKIAMITSVIRRILAAVIGLKKPLYKMQDTYKASTVTFQTLLVEKESLY